MLLLKLFGIVLIVLASAAAGYIKSRSLVLRSKKLSAFLEGINMLYGYIEQEGCELSVAIKNSFSKCDFLSFEKEKIHCNDNDLQAEESQEIENFFSCLGSSVKKTECDRIVDFKLKIQKIYTAAENDVSQKCKVYQSFGICIGLAVGILLI